MKLDFERRKNYNKAKNIHEQNRYDIEIVDRIFQNIRENLTFFDNIIICFCDNFR